VFFFEKKNCFLSRIVAAAHGHRVAMPGAPGLGERAACRRLATERRVVVPDEPVLPLSVLQNIGLLRKEHTGLGRSRVRQPGRSFPGFGAAFVELVGRQVAAQAIADIAAIGAQPGAQTPFGLGDAQHGAAGGDADEGHDGEAPRRRVRPIQLDGKHTIILDAETADGGEAVRVKLGKDRG